MATTVPLIPRPEAPSRALPDYLPARMVNEFVYCPRLFFYEWVDGVFAESADTLEGSAQHKRVDREGAGLPAPEELDEDLKTRSITLSSERWRVIAKTDVVEVKDGTVTPVDFKHGRPRERDGGLELWPTDRVQLALQCLVLRENGYRCEEGIVFYTSTKQRARVGFSDAVMGEALEAVRAAWDLARSGSMPLPLIDSPKCPGCSLVGICLPDEVNALAAQADGDQMPLFGSASGAVRKPAASEARRLVAPRADRRPAYLNTQGLRVGKSGTVLQVKNKDALVQEIRLGELCQLNVMGNIQVSTQAVQALCEAEVPVCWFSQGGWFYGITSGLLTKNVFLRKAQFRLSEEEWFCRRLARRLTAGKIRNQRTLLLRNHIEPDRRVLGELKDLAERAEECGSLETLLGVEGNAARLYFGAFAGMLKASEEDGEAAREFGFDFVNRNRRPPLDPVNAMLSLGYSMLAKDLTIACSAVGLDPMVGFYHQPRFGRPALALDLMEPFRPLIADSAVLSAVNTRMVTSADFVRSGGAVSLTPNGRKAFYRAYEARMDTLVTHPMFEYRMNYRRMLEVQVRLLAKVLNGEVGEYPVFVTR